MAAPADSGVPHRIQFLPLFDVVHESQFVRLGSNSSLRLSLSSEFAHIASGQGGSSSDEGSGSGGVRSGGGISADDPRLRLLAGLGLDPEMLAGMQSGPMAGFMAPLLASIDPQMLARLSHSSNSTMRQVTHPEATERSFFSSSSFFCCAVRFFFVSMRRHVVMLFSIDVNPTTGLGFGWYGGTNRRGQWESARKHRAKC
jgi:hypothetical protein